MEKKFAYSIGGDLHKDSMAIVVLDTNGVLAERENISTRCKNKVREFFSSYGLQSQVTVESVGFYQWFWELVRPVVGKMYLADPTGVRACAGARARPTGTTRICSRFSLMTAEFPVLMFPRNL